MLAPALSGAQDPVQQAGSDAQPPPAAVPSGPPMTVRGMVMNAATGEPLPRVLVRIEGDAAAGVLTDGEGRFAIPNVPLGPQSIRLRKPGYRDRPYATEEVDDQMDGPAHNVLVAPRMLDLGFTLTPIGAIHGHVELSTGDPAQGISVILLKQVLRYGRAVWVSNATTRTASDGAYRFGGLPDGVYAIYTEPMLESEPAVSLVAPGSAANVERSGYPSVFFPDARELSSAAHIRLGIGQQTQADLLLTLEPFETVTATAVFPNGRQFATSPGAEARFGQSSVTISILDADGHRLPYVAQFEAATGTVQTALPDGIYTMQVAAKLSDPTAASAGGMVVRGKANQTLYSGFTELFVAGHAVTNLHIPISPTPSWPVHLRAFRTALRQVQSNAPSVGGLESMVTVSATVAGEIPMDGMSDSAQAEPSGPDQLDLIGAGFGPLWINVLVNDRSVCVDSFTAGGINLARDPLNISPTAIPPPMELTLRDNCAQVTLQLPPSLSTFQPGDEPFYTVYLVPDFDTPVDLPPMTIHASSGANLTLEGLTPGGYHVYVFDNPVRLEYRNPAALAALAAHGQAVALSPGGNVTLVLEVRNQ